MLKDLLQGKPFGHPLHPALVHLPIGLFVFSLLLDAASLLADDGNSLVRGAFYALLFGIVAALVAAIPGFVDWSDIRADHPARKTATTHMLLNIAAVAVFTVDLVLRFNEQGDALTPALPLLLSIAGIGILSVSGYLGGTLVYDDGIAVGRHRRQSATPERTVAVSSKESVDGFVAVADADSLADRETLRVDVDGTVLTIANVGGERFAFQGVLYAPLRPAVGRLPARRRNRVPMAPLALRYADRQGHSRPGEDRPEDVRRRGARRQNPCAHR